MSQLLIHKFLNDLHDLRKVTGKGRETHIREAFKDMLKAWGRIARPRVSVDIMKIVEAMRSEKR